MYYLKELKKELYNEIFNTFKNGNIGPKLKYWRKFFNISQIELSKELNFKASVISDYERGRRTSIGILLLRRWIKGIINLTSISEK